MLTASSDRAVTTQQGDRQAQYWAFFTHDEVPCWPFVPHGPEDRKAAEAPAPQSRPPVAGTHATVECGSASARRGA